MLTIVITVIVALIGIVAYVIVSDMRSRRRLEEERRAQEEARKRKPRPKVHTRKREEEPAPSSPDKPTARKETAVQTEKDVVAYEPADLKTPHQLEEEPVETVAYYRLRYIWSRSVPASLPLPVITTESLIRFQEKREEQPTEEEEVTLPSEEYPPFSHQRLLDMGLSDDDAKEFVQELIPQIEEQIPQIEKALEEEDFHKMERLTHSIKGSSTNVGTGGVADVLVDYNTYLKSGENKAIASRYLEILKTYLAKLKERYLS